MDYHDLISFAGIASESDVATLRKLGNRCDRESAPQACYCHREFESDAKTDCLEIY
jgi:hypothetical protein